MRIEAIFGGVLALFVLGVALYALTSNRIGGPGPDNDRIVVTGGSSDRYAAEEESGVCQCFNEAFDLAGSDVGVMSSQYRTGFEQCRSVLGVDGGEAWTAGWNARLSARPYEASCRNYLRRSI